MDPIPPETQTRSIQLRAKTLRNEENFPIHDTPTFTQWVFVTVIAAIIIVAVARRRRCSFSRLKSLPSRRVNDKGKQHQLYTHRFHLPPRSRRCARVPRARAAAPRPRRIPDWSRGGARRASPRPSRPGARASPGSPTRWPGWERHGPGCRRSSRRSSCYAWYAIICHLVLYFFFFFFL